MAKRIAFFIADGFQTLDLFGPLDTFVETNSFVNEAYQCDIVSFSEGAVRNSAGHKVIADFAISTLDQVDYLIVCGGSGMRTLALNASQLASFRALSASAERVISICTGAFLLAQIFCDEPKKLTTHWRHCHTLASENKCVEVDPEPLFINDDNVWSSAGILSGVDLALEIVKQDHGNTIASAVAKELVVYLQRKGNQQQFSDLLQHQSAKSIRLAPLLDWIVDNLQQKISVGDLAEQVCVSPRQITRMFNKHMNTTPAAYIAKIRMYQARDMLNEGNHSLAAISRRVGFTNYESFRRAFEREFGLSPSDYSS